MWQKQCVPDLKVVDDITKQVKLYCDNEPLVCYSCNKKSSVVSKHINIKYYIIKEIIKY